MQINTKLLLATTVLAFLGFAQCKNNRLELGKEDERLEIAAAFEYWNMGRMYPDGQLHTEKLQAELAKWQAAAAERGGPAAVWEPLGPMNIGGRTLSLAVHPTDTNILFMGAASGGLWKSTTQGRGEQAWQRVETGFPVIGVGAIAIDPVNPNVMYIGTGEVYNYENSAPNNVIRTTRGTYGIGILKSTDGGATWVKSWDVNYDDLTGVQEIKINPLRPQTVYATTTEGILRSYDAGASWQLVFERKMAVDLDLHPTDTSIVIATFGSLDDNSVSGIFRSQNGGNSFQKLTLGLPPNYSGKALVDISKSNPNIMYASIGDAFVQLGLYKTTNGGTSWQAVSTFDVCKYQGWYSHDVAIDPTDPNRLLWCGIDMFVSPDGGSNVLQVSYWYNWDLGFTPVGGPEGPTDYVHADIHHIYFSPHHPNTVFCVTDGGLFASYNGGYQWHGRNGYYQTQQFYANFSNSALNPNRAIGGMQDNGSAIYYGNPGWKRVIGGDGGCTAINPVLDEIMIGSSQNGNFYLSNDDFDNLSGLLQLPGNASAFIAPLEIDPSNFEVVYAGRDILCRQNLSAGTEWEELSSAGGVLVTIALNPTDGSEVYYSRAPEPNGTVGPKIFKTNTSTLETTEMTGLPDRICMDIAYSPSDANTVYAVFSGFGTEHLYRTLDGGNSWQPIPGLPDVPTNSVLVDPQLSAHIYVANDLGVWFSPDGGANWEHLSSSGPQAMLAMHLSISANRKLRVATHGLGVWQTDMVYTVSTQEVAQKAQYLKLSPNPATDQVQLQWDHNLPWEALCSVTTLDGRTVIAPHNARLSQGQTHTVPVGHLPKGLYLVVLQDPKNGQKTAKRLSVL